MATNMETDKETSLISMLPEDVLFDVFDYLQTCERKNAKLVCKSWFRILSRPYFTRFEKLRLPKLYDLATIMEVIDNWSHDKINLELVRHKIYQNSELFWKRCGPKINSLSFDGCSFYPDMTSQIFEHCVNLEEFVNDGSSFNEPFPKRLAQNFFRKSGTNHLSRPKLLKLDFGRFVHVLPSDLNNIASAFPNLKILKFELFDVMGNGALYFPTIQNLLETGQMVGIKEIDVYSYSTNDDLDFPNNVRSAQNFISLNRNVKVTVSLAISCASFTENNIRQISSYNFLTSLYITLCDFENPTDMTLLARFINESPMLNHLRFTLFVTTIENFCIIWSALVNSRLTSLYIDVDVLDATFLIWNGSILEIDSYLAGLRSNNTVRTLHFNDKEGGEFSFLFPKYFQGVYELYVRRANPSPIFLHQKQLRTIDLFIENPLDIFLSPTTIESIEYINVSGPYAMELFSFYRFPNLKNLSFCLRKTTTSQEETVLGQTTEDSFRTKLQKLASILLVESPKLTSVLIKTFVGEAFEFLFQFCREFPNLQHIYLKMYGAVPDETWLMQEITEHADQWSSLKELSIVTRDSDISYFFHEFKGEYYFGFFQTSTNIASLVQKLSLNERRC